MPPSPLKLPLRGTFGNGFEFKSEDEEYVLQFHDLTQFDGRFFLEGTQQRVRDTFVIPRQWFIFNGRLTRPFEYYVAFAEGFDTLNLLDAYLNLNYDKRLNVRLGRYKTPFTYEFYAEPIQGLLNNERSLFFNNFGVNRDLGIMPWGRIWDERIDYAVGIFNGTRNAYVDTNDEKDLMAFLNFRPWSQSDNEALKLLQFGGSTDLGQQNNSATPLNLRTNVATNGNEAAGVEFLRFNTGTREVGFRNFWTAHLVWFYKSLSLISEYGGGYQRYANEKTPWLRDKTPVQSFYVQMGYFLTGETVQARGMAAPIRPFDIRKGKWGPGAFELAGRYNYLDVGDNVFRGGFSNPDDWTHRIQLLDLGVNWYLTRYIKVYMGWEKAMFATPVLFSSDHRQIDSDMFWFRTQIYF
jgi:phosphate-selective porin OprO and OprP